MAVRLCGRRGQHHHRAANLGFSMRAVRARSNILSGNPAPQYRGGGGVVNSLREKGGRTSVASHHYASRVHGLRKRRAAAGYFLCLFRYQVRAAPGAVILVEAVFFNSQKEKALARLSTSYSHPVATLL